MKTKTLILIPAYEEQERIGGVLRSLKKSFPLADVLVVDDGSSDGTAAEARHGGALVVRHPFNLGYGAALQTGYLFASRRGYGLVAQLDADGQHEPADLKALLAPLEEGSADLVVGSRWLQPETYSTSAARRLGSRFFSRLASLASGQEFTDPTSGFKAVSTPLIRLFASRVFPSDYPDADFLFWLNRQGYRVSEVPVRMYASDKAAGMHSGWKPVYYVFKVLLSFGLNYFRK
jgi:glycosyltransferase involved in cell wall biosynthesis